MDGLVAICEGGIHTVEYLHKNGVYPRALLIEPSKFQEISPYLTKDDDVLLVIQGLTDFTMAGIYNVLSKFEEFKERYKRVTILTNIPLGNVPYDYYLYSGDLFYGDVKLISKKKSYELDENGNVMEKKKPTLFGKKKKEEQYKKNPIMFQFKKYNNKKTRIMIYGKVSMTEPVSEAHLQEYEDRIKVIDLYKDKKVSEVKDADAKVSDDKSVISVDITKKVE